MKWLRAFKESSLQTKIFFIVTFGVGLLTLWLCIYPYIWMDQHRTTPKTVRKK